MTAQAHHAIEQEPLRQPDIFERSIYLATEFLNLAQAFHDAAVKLEAALANRSLPGMRSAYLDIDKITDQAAALKGGLLSAIEKETERLDR